MKHRTYDPWTGIESGFQIEDGKMREHFAQNVDPILDANQRLANAAEYAKRGIRQGWQHVARIPASLVLFWMVHDGFDANRAHPDEILAKLRAERRDYSKVLTTSGRF